MQPEENTPLEARWWGIDWVFAVWTAGTVVLLVAAWSRIPAAGALIAGHVLALAAYLGAKRGARSSRGWRAVYLLSPLALLLAVFESLGEIIPHLRTVRYDDALAEIDLWIFGSDPTGWFDLTPLTAGILQVCYVSYYLLPVTVVLLAYFRGKHRTLLRQTALIVSCFFTTYVGYYLVPALGPRFYFEYDAPLPLSPFAQALNDLVNFLENIKLDVFPSGHTALSVVCLAMLFREARVVAWCATPLVVGLIVATVALRYHYGIDVIAGLVCAVPWIVWSLRPPASG